MRRTRPRLWLIFLIALVIAVLVFFYRHYAGRQGGEQGKIDAAVAELMQAMSLEEKAGQVIIAYFSGPDFASNLARELRELPLGAVARNIDRESITLVRDRAAVLPLSPAQRRSWPCWPWLRPTIAWPCPAKTKGK